VVEGSIEAVERYGSCCCSGEPSSYGGCLHDLNISYSNPIPSDHHRDDPLLLRASLPPRSRHFDLG
jgi:hypothetical protein